MTTCKTQLVVHVAFGIALVCSAIGCTSNPPSITPTDKVAAGEQASPKLETAREAFQSEKLVSAPAEATPMQLGNFSVSLAVKDLAVSRAFYEKLGFRVTFGNKQNYVIMQNETATIGLFQGMFDKNILTFNPGWDRNTATLTEFDDVRTIQKRLKEQGLELAVAADETTTGPASLTLQDPDGNQILIDQHVASPKK